MSAQVCAFGKVLAQQAVGVLIRPSLPRAMRIAEEDRQAGVYSQLSMLSHLSTLVPGQRSAQLLRQIRDRGGDRVSNGLGAVACESGSVLGAGLIAMAIHPGQVHQYGESCAALDEGPDCRAIQPKDEVAFPVSGDSAVVGLGRSFANHDLRTEKFLPRPWVRVLGTRSARPVRRHATSSTAQGTTALYIEGLVNRLVRDPHRYITRKIDRKPVQNLLRAPCGRPLSVLTAAVPATIPRVFGPGTSVPLGALSVPARCS